MDIFKKIFPALGASALAGMILFSAISCAPSYPKEILPEAVKTVCKSEYGMEVDVVVEGSTMGMYHSMEGLLDENMGISKDAWETISNLILIASRVVLSTDADINFYCVITQDVRMPELQVVIIKYVNDVKLGMYRNISRNEAFKRTLFSINLTPQAKKERSVENIFSKIGVGDDVREKVMDEFFRSTPTKISDIGYWRGQFYLKDVTMPEFLAAQIANRIKIDFRSEKPFMEDFIFRSAEGSYTEGIDAGYFIINFNIAKAPSETKELKTMKVRKLLEITSEVVSGYRYDNFNFVIMNDQVEDVRLRVEKKDIYEYDPRKTLPHEIVQAPKGYFGL
jgi:hypothetical protein